MALDVQKTIKLYNDAAIVIKTLVEINSSLTSQLESALQDADASDAKAKALQAKLDSSSNPEQEKLLEDAETSLLLALESYTKTKPDTEPAATVASPDLPLVG